MWLRFHRFIWGVGNLGTHSLTAVHQFGVDSTFHRVFLLLCWAKEKKKKQTSWNVYSSVKLLGATKKNLHTAQSSYVTQRGFVTDAGLSFLQIKCKTLFSAKCLFLVPIAIQAIAILTRWVRRLPPSGEQKQTEGIKVSRTNPANKTPTKPPFVTIKITANEMPIPTR